MGTFGRQVVTNVGLPLEVAADGNPEWKAGGITIDWSTVVAVSADTTLPDYTVVKNGYKYLRFGQVLTRIGVREVQTIQITGSPTGGTFTITLEGETTSALAYNASANAVEQALNSLPSRQPGDVSVTLSGSTYTLTFRNGMGNVTQVTTTNSFTGGTSPDTTIGTTTAGAGSGKFGPYDPAATDGRQTLARGNVFILNETLLESGFDPTIGAGRATDHPGVIEGGKVWKGRILATAGTASLAAGPTYANLETAMPRLTYAEQG